MVAFKVPGGLVRISGDAMKMAGGGVRDGGMALRSTKYEGVNATPSLAPKRVCMAAAARWPTIVNRRQ